jgi:hypothetical protein
MQQLIDRYCRFDRTGADGVRYQTTTAVALVENGLLHKIPAAIAPFVRPGPIALVCDAITRAVAADALDTLLQQAGFETVLFELAPSPGEEIPRPSTGSARFSPPPTLASQSPSAQAASTTWSRWRPTASASPTPASRPRRA